MPKKVVGPASRQGQVALEAKFDNLLVEFRHVMYGNGDIGVLEAARALNKAVQEHSQAPIHAPETYETLKKLEALADAFNAAKKKAEDEAKNRRRVFFRAAVDIVSSSLKWLAIAGSGFLVSYVASHWSGL